MLSMVLSMAPLHSLGQDNQIEMQHDLLVMPLASHDTDAAMALASAPKVISYL